MNFCTYLKFVHSDFFFLSLYLLELFNVSLIFQVTFRRFVVILLNFFPRDRQYAYFQSLFKLALNYAPKSIEVSSEIPENKCTLLKFIFLKTTHLKLSLKPFRKA